MEQGRGATGSPRVCLRDALANRLGWTPRLPGLVPRGGPRAGEKGRVNVAPHARRGLSSLLAYLAPRRRLRLFLLPPTRSMQQSPGTLREHPAALPLPPVGTRSRNPAGPSRASRRSLRASPRPFSRACPASLLPAWPWPGRDAPSLPRSSVPRLSCSQHCGGPGFRCSTRHSPIAGCLCLSVRCLSAPLGFCLIHC